jgi:hypothetical protein
MFIDSTTLPLHRDPIHNVCDIPAARWKSADGPIIYTITYRRNAAKTKWYTAVSLHFYSDGPQDCKSSDITLRICVVILKCSAAYSLIFKNLNGKTPLKILLLSSGTTCSNQHTPVNRLFYTKYD